MYDKIINAVREIAKNETPCDNIDIAEILQKHKCFYLLVKNKNINYTANDLLFNKAVINARYKNCEPVFDSLKLKKIPYAVIKGAVLSQTAYGGVIYRKSRDIDLLAGRDNIDYLTNIMHDNGFIQGRITDDGIIPFTRQEILFYLSLTHQVAPFVKKTDDFFCEYVRIDINMNILWGEHNKKSDMNYILSVSNTTDTDICGVKVSKLNTIIEFISLCLHHYKDMNSIYLLAKGKLKLYLFCDIYFYLINNQNQIDAIKLAEECDKLNVTEYIYYCVYHANTIFDDDRLNKYISVLENQKGKNILDNFGLDDSERKVWDMTLYERLFSDKFHEKFEALLNEKDKEKIRNNRFFM